MAPPPFDLFGAVDPVSPVVISVPHAGRDYPAALLAALRVPASALIALEDRHVDAIALAAIGAETMLVQRRARAWIDLNRGEDERDPRVDDGARAHDAIETAKMKSGLGLIPRRVTGAGDIWRRRLGADEVTARIVADHRPYHDTLARLLTAARARFGVAVLLDIHSMPPLGPGQARVVIGDRFGQSAASRFVERCASEARAAGLGCALNTPYAGGHILARHGRPAAGIHAVQLEIDRALYLDHRFDRAGAGLAAAARLVRRIADALADEALADLVALAAE